MLEVAGIDVFYGDVQVLWDLSFEVKKGEIVALIGANGSGKTTTLSTVSSLLKPRKGSVTYEGSADPHARPLTTWSTSASPTCPRRGVSSPR